MFNLFETQAEINTRIEAFEKRIFPQGPTQKEAIKVKLQSIFPNHDIKFIMYEYIALKDDTLNGIQPKYKFIAKPKFTKAQIKNLKEILEADLRSDSI